MKKKIERTCLVNENGERKIRMACHSLTPIDIIKPSIEQPVILFGEFHAFFTISNLLNYKRFVK